MRRRGSPANLLRRIAFFFACVGALYLPMTPLAPGENRIAPDMLYCVCMAWLLRDPDSAPFWIILPIGLLADFMLARPLGLGALALLLATEVARHHRDVITGVNVLFEWILVILGFALMWLCIQVALWLTFSGGPDLHTTLRIVLETALLYPVLSLATILGMRIFGPGPGSVYALARGGRG